MSITVPEPIAERGKKDARRHREKQREAIRKQLPEIISEESIITRGRGKTVRVPIRSITIPQFRPGSRQKEGSQGDNGAGGVGIGQGSSRPGDVIGRRPAPSQGPGGEAGDEAGQEYIESEIELEELISMMLEDLGLPRLEKKEVAELEVVLGFQIRGIKKSGPRPLLDSRRSSRTPFGRFFAFLQILVDQTGRDELACFHALKQAGGDLSEYVEGHTDHDPIKRSKKRFRSNRHLSAERADAVIRFLTKQCGVPESHVVLVGYGPYDPMAKGSGKPMKARNRRVEIVVGEEL